MTRGRGERPCEFPTKGPHEVPYEFIVSRKDEEGHLRREQHFCKPHFVDYAETVKEEIAQEAMA